MFCATLSHSHSVVPGGFAVKSYNTLDMPGIDATSDIIF